MGYFDGLAQASFNTDERGRQLYFPHGRLGKGYVLNTLGDYERYLSFHKNRLMYMLIPIVVLAALRIDFKILLCLFLVIAATDFVVTHFKVKGLERTVNTFNMKQSSLRSSKAFGLPILLFLGIVSVLFTLAGILLAIGAAQSEIRIIGAILTGIFGLATFSYVRKISFAVSKK